MSFLSRLFQSSRSPSRRKSAARQAGLQIESLEQRWTPTVSVAGQGTDVVEINDSEFGPTGNSVVIIDDLDTLTTYVRINNGKEQQLGSSGKLLSDLTINMGAGNDKVVFTVRGSDNAYDGNLNRKVDLGLGNDILEINFGANTKAPTQVDLGGWTLDYDVIGATAGNDSYTVSGGVKNGSFRLDLATVPEATGNDKYTFNLAGEDALIDISTKDLTGNDTYKAILSSKSSEDPVSLQVVDQLGNDSYTLTVSGQNAAGVTTNVSDHVGNDTYTLTVGASTSATLTQHIEDSGPGKNTLKFTQNALTGVAQSLVFDVSDGASTNTVTLGGNALINNSSLCTSVVGGAGLVNVTFDDNILGDGSTQSLFVKGGDRNDKVTVKLDGKPKLQGAAIKSGSDLSINVCLGEGNDTFTTNVQGAYWGVNDGGAGETGLAISVNGDAGNDSITFAGGSKPLLLNGLEAYFYLDLDGGEGNDTIGVNLGNIGGVSNDGGFVVLIDAGAGADRVTVAGFLYVDNAGLDVVVSVDLGEDSDKDSLKSSFRTALPRGDVLDASLTFTYFNPTPDVDVLQFSTSPLAPEWLNGVVVL